MKTSGFLEVYSICGEHKGISKEVNIARTKTELSTLLSLIPAEDSELFPVCSPTLRPVFTLSPTLMSLCIDSESVPGSEAHGTLSSTRAI